MILNSIIIIIDDHYPACSYYLKINGGEKFINTTISYYDTYPDMNIDKLACTHLANKLCIWLDDQTKERFDILKNLLYKLIKQNRALRAIKEDFE